MDTALADFYEGALAAALSQVNVAEGGVTVAERMLRQWFDRELITAANTRGTVFRTENTTAGMPNALVDALQRQFLLRTELRAGAPGSNWCTIALSSRSCRPIAPGRPGRTIP